MVVTAQTINGLAVRSAGPADASLTVLLIHYWGGTSRTWDRTIQALHNVNPSVRAISYDQRGWGASIKPNDDPSTTSAADAYSIASLATDAEDVLLGLEPKPTRVVLVGHSMGGKVAQLLAARWRQQTSKGSDTSAGITSNGLGSMALVGLILVAPAPPSPIILPPEAKQQLQHAYDTPESIRFILQNVLTAANETGGNSLDEEVVQQVVEDSMSGGPLARLTWPESAMPEDIEAEVTHWLGLGSNGEDLEGEERAVLPTLIVVGEFDKVEPPAMLREKVLPKIKGATMEEVRAAGHLLPLEIPEQLGANFIAQFLSRLST